MLILTIEECEKMRLEFPDIYSELFKGAYERLQRELIMKLEIIKKQEVKLLSNEESSGPNAGNGA
jgi:hypothetical protein